MRKSTKIAVVLAAAALLVAGFAFTTLAKGWVKEGEGLYYYEDEYGMKVYNEWKKDGANFYYLGDDGYMVTDKLVWDNDGYHWCGADGARVANQWIQVPASEEDQNDLGVDYRWYRFNKKGIAVTGKQTVEGETYFFDGDGKMLYGYVSVDSNGAVTGWTTKASESYVATSDDVYYCGTNEEGKALKGAWRQESKDTSGDSWEGADTFWGFYQTSGKRATSALANGALWNGQRYYFDDDGKMIYGWQTATVETYNDGREDDVRAKYFGGADDGKMVKKAWVYAVPQSGKDKTDEKKRWFYFDNSGLSITAEDGCVRKINGKFYAFGAVEDDNTASKMLSGLVEVQFGDDESLGEANHAKAAKINVGTDTDVWKAASAVTLNQWISSPYTNFYFFSNDEANDGSLKKSTSFEQEFLDDTYTLYVNKEGKLTNGYVSKKYYVNGYLMKADADARYQIKNVWYYVDATATEDGYWTTKNVVLSTAGSEITKGYVADADGTYYVVKSENIYVADSSLLAPAQTASAWNNKKADADATFKYDGNTYKVTAERIETSNIYRLFATKQ